MFELGDKLIDLAASSNGEFVMCAPFAKREVVVRILSVLPEGVSVRLYTRWRPEEVAAGVSDTAVLQAIRARGGTVYLQDRLHAKFYRNEFQVLLGSANLTATALGWSSRPNVELLVNAERAVVTRVEQWLSSESIEATDEIAEEVDAIARGLQIPGFVAPSALDRTEIAAGMWIPQLRMPADLYAAYSRGLDSLTSKSAASAALDLVALELPQGLSEKQFYLLVGHRLKQQVFVQAADAYLCKPRRFGEVRDWISQHAGLDRREASDVWQTLMRWMMEFLPDRYVRSVSRHSEIFSRRETAEESAS